MTKENFDNEKTEFVSNPPHRPVNPKITKADSPAQKTEASGEKKFNKSTIAAGAVGGILIGTIATAMASGSSNDQKATGLEDAKVFGEEDKDLASVTAKTTDGTNQSDANDSTTGNTSSADNHNESLTAQSEINNSSSHHETIELGDQSIINNGTINIYTTAPVSGVSSNSGLDDNLLAEDEIQVEEIIQAETFVEEPSNHYNDLIVGDINVSYDVNDDMSFGQAFATARAEIGSGGVFEWRGNLYSTHTAEEWNNMSTQERMDYNSNFAWHNLDNSQSNTYYNEDIYLAEEFDDLDYDIYDDYDTNGEIEVLGVDYDPESGYNYAALEVDGQNVVLVDVDDVPGYDIMLAEDDNGEIVSLDIKDHYIMPEDVLDLADNNMIESYFTEDDNLYDITDDNNDLYEI